MLLVQARRSAFPGLGGIGSQSACVTAPCNDELGFRRNQTVKRAFDGLRNSPYTPLRVKTQDREERH